MWYLGGKMRQAKHIVAAVEDGHVRYLGGKRQTYVEPFCGALWSAVAVMKKFPDWRFVLNDINPHLITLWKYGRDGWNPPQHPTEKDYHHYNKTRPANDPMTGYLGFAWSFGGKFFGGAARTNGKFKGSFMSTMSKIETLRKCDVQFSCESYDKVKIPNKAIVYLDPPYEGRTPQAKHKHTWNQDDYYVFAERLAKTNYVIATEFLNPRRWPVIHNYGDTVVRHLNAKPKDGTEELLLRVVLR